MVGQLLRALDSLCVPAIQVASEAFPDNEWPCPVLILITGPDDSFENYVALPDIKESTSIGTLKELIGGASGILLEEQLLRNHNKTLRNLDSTCEPEGIRSGFLLRLIRVPASAPLSGSLVVFVRTLTGSLLTLWTASHETFGQVKQKIQNRDGTYVPDEQRLIFRGKSLEAERTLGDYGIQHESTMLLVVPLGAAMMSHVSSKCSILVEIGINTPRTMSA
jgi:hypothetical protein